MEFKTKLIQKREEAKGTKTFVFEKPADFDYLAGQYAYFTLPQLKYPDDRGNTRHFTLSSSPTEGYISLTTRLRDSGFKKTLNELPLKSELSVRGPQGDFVLQGDSETQQVMIAGGIGITPFRSITRYLADKNLTVPIHLIYSNSIPEEITFKEELDKIATEHPNIKVDYTITKPEESNVSWSGHVGRIDEKYLSELTSTYHEPIFWLCGPPPLVSAIEEVLAKLDIPNERIHSEKFTGY